MRHATLRGTWHRCGAGLGHRTATADWAMEILTPLSIAIRQLIPCPRPIGRRRGPSPGRSARTKWSPSRQAWIATPYLVVPDDQKLTTDAQQQVFSRFFGELEHTGGSSITMTPD